MKKKKKNEERVVHYRLLLTLEKIEGESTKAVIRDGKGKKEYLSGSQVASVEYPPIKELYDKLSDEMAEAVQEMYDRMKERKDDEIPT